MEIRKEEQREFFEEFKKPERAVDRLRKKYMSHRRFFVTVPVENMVLASIFAILLIVFAFSLGVERGKGLGDFGIARIDKIPERVEIAEEVVLPAPEKKSLSSTITETLPAPKYTIQAATFRKEATAGQEIASLEKEGFTAFMAQKGDFFQVCVGKYVTAEEAEADLTKIKTKYNDGYLRKIE